MGLISSSQGGQSSYGLKAEFQVYAIDLRGQGPSTWTPGRYNLTTWGHDVANFIDLVVGRPTIVAGNSSGERPIRSCGVATPPSLNRVNYGLLYGKGKCAGQE